MAYTQGIALWWLLLLYFVGISLCKPSNNVNTGERDFYKNLEKIMDPKVDPCRDFYTYACGNWPQVHANKEYKDNFDYISLKNNMQLGVIFRRLQSPQEKTKPSEVIQPVNYIDSKFVQNLVDYYQSCIAVANSDPQRYLVWMEVFEHVVWPSLKKPNSNKDKHLLYDWVKLLAQLRKYEMNDVFITENVMLNLQDTTKLRVDIDKPIGYSGFKALTDEDWNMLIESLKLQKDTALEKLWLRINDFENSLHQLDEANKEDDGIELMSYANLDPLWLKRYVAVAFDGANYSNIDFTVNNVKYMRDLEALVSKTDQEFVSTYLEVRFIWHLLRNSPTSFKRENCFAHMRDMLPLAMDWLYEQEKDDLFKQTDFVRDIFNELKATFHTSVHNHAHRLPADAAQILFNKIDAMELKINNLPRFNSSIRLEVYYQYLSFNALDFYNNHLVALKFRFEKVHEQLSTPLAHNANEFFYVGNIQRQVSSLPFYINRANLVILPLTLLQMPVYQPDLPDIFKYSALGFLLAHEVLHGFDETRLHLDNRGQSKNQLWPVLKDAIIRRNLDCLHRHFSDKDLDTKIADINGLKVAYETYFDGVKRPNSELADMGIDSPYSKEQLFFINFAQLFCNKDGSDINAHSGERTGQERVNDAVSNFDEFGSTYKCRRGSKMRPMHKCKLWR